MTKQEQFLWIVQTSILANAIHLSTDENLAREYLHVRSSTGVRFTMADAVEAAEKIPTDMSASEAADDFCIYMFENVRDGVKESSGEEMQVPHWFASS